MSSQHSPVTRFLLRVVIWLPPMFAAWYYLSILLTWPVAWLTDLTLTGLFPEWVEAVRQHGNRLEVLTGLAVPAMQGMSSPPGAVGEIQFSVNPLIYGYCLPLYSALVLASPGEEGDRWGRLLWGLILLYPVQAFGVTMEILKTLLIQVGPHIGRPLVVRQWQYEITALGYQFGYLILPAVTPLIVWMGFYRGFLAKLAPGIAGRFG